MVRFEELVLMRPFRTIQSVCRHSLRFINALSSVFCYTFPISLILLNILNETQLVFTLCTFFSGFGCAVGNATLQHQAKHHIRVNYAIEHLHFSNRIIVIYRITPMNGRIAVRYADVASKSCPHYTIIKGSIAAKNHLYAKRAVSIAFYNHHQ